MVTPDSRVAVYTTIYPGVEPFLREWSRSLELQTDRSFALCVGLDGLRREQVEPWIGDVAPASWFDLDGGATPALVRQRAMASMVEDYDAIVFVDSDDVLLPDRVASAREALERHDVTACALRLMAEDGRPLDAVFGDLPDDVEWSEFLPRYNVFGLSNSSYRSETLRRCLPLPSSSILSDWLLVVRAWMLGARLDFDTSPRMRYRQHGANVTRLLPPFSERDVLSASERVVRHYDCLFDPSWPLPEAARGRFESERGRFRLFHDAIRRSPELLARYTAELNRLRPPYHVWFWCVAHPELEWQWKN